MNLASHDLDEAAGGVLLAGGERGRVERRLGSRRRSRPRREQVVRVDQRRSTSLQRLSALLVWNGQHLDVLPEPAVDVVA